MARYRDAIQWIVIQDDTNWVDEPLADAAVPVLSVTAALVADLFGKTDVEVVKDIKKALRRESYARVRHLARPKL